jgi:hypothetical protein
MTNAAIAALFALTQQFLDASPATVEKVEKITARKLTVIHRNDESDRDFNNYELKATKGAFTRLELHVPKALGGVSLIIDLRDKPKREDILKRFGPPSYPEYASGGRKMLGQSYKGQSLLWVLDKEGSAERLVIQDGR